MPALGRAKCDGDYDAQGGRESCWPNTTRVQTRIGEDSSASATASPVACSSLSLILTKDAAWRTRSIANLLALSFFLDFGQVFLARLTRATGGFDGLVAVSFIFRSKEGPDSHEAVANRLVETRDCVASTIACIGFAK